MAALLEIAGLTVAYGKLPVVHGISFSVAPGEFSVLLGRNGAGKTTTLRAISGLIPKRGGRVLFDGSSIGGLSPRRIIRRGLVQVLDGHRVFPSLSVEDNLLLSAFGAGRRAVPGLLDPVYDAFPEMAEWRHLHASRLSGGQQQILAVAQGLVAEPRLLILDEPSAGLAPLVVDRILLHAKSLTATGTAVLLVEQFVEKALLHADHCHVLDHGEIVGAGTPAELGRAGFLERIYLGA